MSDNYPAKSEFQIMDDHDARQIETADSAVRQALVYRTKNGKRQLSYTGIKWLVLKMAQNEQSLEIPDLPQVELVKHDESDQKTWIWYAMIKVRNAKTGLETIGASEQNFIDEYKGNIYDQFGRTKAISKAERNAYRKQIPELEINAMMDTVSAQSEESIYNDNRNYTSTTTPSDNTPTEKQLDYLQSLGYTGPAPKSKQEASDQIEKIKNGATTADMSDNTGYQKNCICDKFIPNSVNGKTCQTCKKLAPLNQVQQ